MSLRNPFQNIRLFKVNGGKSQANDDKAMIMRRYLLNDKDFHKITMDSFNGRVTDRLTTLPQYIPLR